MYFCIRCKKWLQVYLLATSGGGRRCKANFILSLLYKRKTYFSSSSVTPHIFASLFIVRTTQQMTCKLLIVVVLLCACTGIVHSVALMLIYSAVFYPYCAFRLVPLPILLVT